MSVLAGVLLGACGGGAATSTTPPTATSTPKSSTAAAPDACVLLTAAQASAVAGTDLTKSDTAPVAGMTSICAYANPSGTSVVLGVGRIPNASGVAGLQHSMLKAVSGDLVLTGIGDVAGEGKDQFGVKIAFWKGDVFVFLDATSSTLSADTMAPKLESLAKSIAGKV